VKTAKSLESSTLQQAAGYELRFPKPPVFQLAYAASGGESDPKRLKKTRTGKAVWSMCALPPRTSVDRTYRPGFAGSWRTNATTARFVARRWLVTGDHFFDVCAKFEANVRATTT
jgi:hypothetical protein